MLPPLLALTPDPTLVIDRHGTIAAADARLGELVGWEPAELVGRCFDALVPQGVLDPDLRLTARSADGGEIPIEISVRVVEGIDGVAGPALAVAIRDVTLRRRRAAGLRASAERFRMQAAEAERARWARELHDETLQGLAALHVLLSSGVRAKTPELMRERIGLAQEQIEGAMENLRGLINDLRPAALDELGLEASVRDLAERVQSVYGIEIETRVALRGDDGAPRRLATEVETTAYRVVQECLSNAARHAGATRIAVEITQPHGAATLRVRVRDDGHGFAAEETDSGGGYGLRSMRERVDLLEGELTLSSGSDAGTEIVAVLPLTS
ncbi:sensor histidine kinase [Conexibacter woesei]|uniref:Oxygen sensor histidine kinase NreB n=1 Tax=Conexibacter woesei (strain DSM 14684 / CCUG 47730 / CIP 108061 / JCM 11494 / NBRC 100937 / ID131577) TaxID=469383 RepID=D3FC91_CONWI|nr:ATP-binding protein [Conexibacter woesei]ADB53386.1 PAS/PAC sensor signal transduction histidine kinase [Conexibacter woesei DSM 14684]